MNVHRLASLAVMTLLLVMPIGVQSSEDWSSDKGTSQLQPNVVTGLIVWIVAKTGWIVQEPPPIHFIPHTQLVEMYCGASSSNLDIRALYSPKDHIIYLPENWKPSDLHDRSALLHELVHHLQALNNVKAKCLAACEPQAFHLQIEWLHEQGSQDPHKFIGVDEFTISVISQCRE